MLGSEFHVPFWVVLSCQAAMALGTLLGGWRIVHTMGSRITKLKPIQGFCAETGGAAHAVPRDVARRAGIDDAHHHRRDRRGRRGAAGLGGALDRGEPIVYAWVITIPASALVAALAYWAVNLIHVSK